MTNAARLHNMSLGPGTKGFVVKNSNMVCLMRVVILVLSTIAAVPANADESAAQAWFEAGNEAYVRSEYQEALNNYSAALANGKDTSRLYFNMGLAHYHLDQYDQAEQAFNESAADPELRALSYYTLGLVAKGRGDRPEAIRYFERSRQVAVTEKLRNNARTALGVLGVEQYREVDDRGPVSERQDGFEIDISVRAGYDDNLFRAPELPYIDLSDPLMPVPVTPQKQSGFYVPIRIGANYAKPVGSKSSFVWSYRYLGDLYVDSAFSDANISRHRFAFGGERMVGDSGSANRRVAFSIVLKKHDETNLDRDDSLDRFDDPGEVSDRFNYTSGGAETDLKARIGKHRLTIGAGGEVRRYGDVLTGSVYDLSMYWGKGDIRFAVSEKSRLKLGFEYFVRDFDRRRSRDLMGISDPGNPTLEYQYQAFEASFRHRFSERFLAQVAYYHTKRTDQFVGYNDYVQDKFRLTTRFDFTDRWRTNLRFTWRDQEYPNAFAFNDPTQALKSYDDFEIYATTEYEIRDHFSIYGQVRIDDVKSTDPRGEYQRARAAIGFSWNN